MFKRSFLPALALAATVAAAPAQASFGTDAPALCSDSWDTLLNAGYTACQGPLAGLMAPGGVDSVSFDGHGTFALVGRTGDVAGPFANDPTGASWGALMLNAAPRRPFVIGLQAGGLYSLYLFAGEGAGPALGFDTLGVMNSVFDDAPALSGAALFTTAVPEPGAVALMLAGLGVLGFVGRRRGAL